MRQSNAINPTAGNESSRYCSYCNRRVLALPQSRNGVLHVLLTLMTCGLYLPIALWCLLVTRYRCKHCGRFV